MDNAAAITDAHVHVVSSDEERFPRRPTGAGSDWWLEPNGAEELTEKLDATGVAAAVVVQAVGVYGYDCSYASHVVERGAERFAFVAAVDMSSPECTTRVLELGASTRVAGVRLFGVGAAGSEWLTNGIGAGMWDLAAEMGVVLVPTIFPDGLPALRALIESHPSVPVALDHCGFPDLGGPDALANLLSMADLEALHLKATSHNLHTDRDPSILLEALVDAFGPDRICWGSDHPQHNSLAYAEMLELARHACRHLGPHERDLVMGANTRRLWWPTTTEQPGDPSAG